ncbi:ras and Rab interactor 1-like [Mastacembelus armatus]|uniref:ras and Rab interactor 1-like n=1 Tax=Mastacembelus armatus TaxID=205130 RepID=UPI000E45B2D1|nr:ras and Rab interactor 1-like [Mastacembelus armatus]
MAQQEEPLYDFPEPNPPSKCKFIGHQRGGSLKSINILDRLLLTVPVWLQLSINPATALHILRREPRGTFLVRKSRTSQRNVLCVRLADDSMPSFVHQFGIREEHSTLSLEMSAISFPDLPRLISFYCVSRDVLPFPLELPEAIAKATSHKELESISHMGIEFWNSHLNIRGPREALKPQNEEKKADTVNSALPAAALQPSSDSDKQLRTVPESDTATKQPAPSSTVFQRFCPITTRSPRELDCGSGLGALCFINPLFLQSQNTLSRRRLFKHSIKVRVSTETSTMLSPPLAPPPPPPLMPKTKGRCKAQQQGQRTAQTREGPGLLPCTQPKPLTQTEDTPSEAQVQPPSETPHFQPEMQEQDQTQMEPGQTQAEVEGVEATALTVMEHLPEDSDYMQPTTLINSSHPHSLSPYLSPSVSSVAPPLFPKVSPSLSPYSSPRVSPSLSPYQSPSLSPKVPCSLSPRGSPSASPSLSPYHSPVPSPKVPFCLSPFTSPSLPQLAEQIYHTPAPTSRPRGQRSEKEAEDEGAGGDENKEEDDEPNDKLQDKREEMGLDLPMNAASLNDTDSCTSSSSIEGAAETLPHSPHDQDNILD